MYQDQNSSESTSPTSPCPTCGTATSRENNRSFPFCSERCKLVDLGQWMNEGYRIPVRPGENEDADSDLQSQAISNSISSGSHDVDES